MAFIYKVVETEGFLGKTQEVLVNGPLLWTKIINDFKGKAGKKAIVAGGAVRDYLLGEDPRDIDVFVPVKDKDELKSLIPLLGDDYRLHDMDGDTPELIEDYERGSLESFGVVGVLDGFYQELWKINIIGMTNDVVGGELDGDWLVKSFDFAVTRSWYGALPTKVLPRLHDTIEAATDRINDTATLLISESKDRHDRCVRRFESYRDRRYNHNGAALITLDDKTEFAKKINKATAFDRLDSAILDGEF